MKCRNWKYICKLSTSIRDFIYQLRETNSPSISEASPKDVCRFLVWCDTSGKTKFHDNDCYFIGQNQCNLCGCKTVQSSGTVAVMVTQLGHIFRSWEPCIFPIGKRVCHSC